MEEQNKLKKIIVLLQNLHISTMNMVGHFMSRRTQEHKIPGSTEGIL